MTNEENKQNNNANEEGKLRMPPIASELSELELVKKQAQEYLDGWKRAKADYLNLRKEMEWQNKEIKDWMSKVMLVPLLEIMDGFDKAFSSVPDIIKNDGWVKGIEGVKKQLEEYFKTQRVEVILAKGEKFDPVKHEAVESADGGESGIVAEELQKGYVLNGEILRPAKVKVYK